MEKAQEKLIGVVIRHYQFGDDMGGSDNSMYREKLYVGNSLDRIFFDILVDFRVFERLGTAYAYIYEEKLKGKKSITQLYQTYLDIEYAIIDFYYTKIKTAKITVEKLNGLLFWGNSIDEEDEEELVYYKIVKATQDEKEINELKAEYADSIHMQYGI